MAAEIQRRILTRSVVHIPRNDMAQNLCFTEVKNLESSPLDCMILFEGDFVKLVERSCEINL